MLLDGMCLEKEEQKDLLVTFVCNYRFIIISCCIRYGWMMLNVLVMKQVYLSVLVVNGVFIIVDMPKMQVLYVQVSRNRYTLKVENSSRGNFHYFRYLKKFIHRNQVFYMVHTSIFKK